MDELRLTIIGCLVCLGTWLIFRLWFRWYTSDKTIRRKVMREMDAEYGDDPSYQQWKADGGMDTCFERVSAKRRYR